MDRKSFLKNAAFTAISVSIPMQKLLCATSQSLQEGERYVIGDFVFESQNESRIGKIIFFKNGRGKWKIVRDYANGNNNRKMTMTNT
jgi:hypothetical protein